MTGYIALVQKDEGTSYGVSFPDVPGCVSAGDSVDEALRNAEEALAGHLALMRSDGEAEPEARNWLEIKSDPEFAQGAEDAIARREVSPSSRSRFRPIHRMTALPRQSLAAGTEAAAAWKHTRTKELQMAKKTSPKAAKSASKVLRDNRTGKHSKTAAGSALSQKEKGKGRKK